MQLKEPNNLTFPHTWEQMMQTLMTKLFDILWIYRDQISGLLKESNEQTIGAPKGNDIVDRPFVVLKGPNT